MQECDIIWMETNFSLTVCTVYGRVVRGLSLIMKKGWVQIWMVVINSRKRDSTIGNKNNQTENRWPIIDR